MAEYNDFNPRFNLTQEMLSGGQQFNWVLHEDEESITGYNYSDIKLKNPETGVICRVKILLMSDGKRKLTYIPDITKDGWVSLNGRTGNSSFTFKLGLGSALYETSANIPEEVKEAILNLATIMFNGDTSMNDINAGEINSIIPCKDIGNIDRRRNISLILGYITQQIRRVHLAMDELTFNDTEIREAITMLEIKNGKLTDAGEITPLISVTDSDLINEIVKLGYKVERIITPLGAAIVVSGWAK